MLLRRVGRLLENWPDAKITITAKETDDTAEKTASRPRSDWCTTGDAAAASERARVRSERDCSCLRDYYSRNPTLQPVL